MASRLRQLEAGQIESLVKSLRDLQPQSPELAKAVSNEAGYFGRNAQRMRYPAFRP